MFDKVDPVQTAQRNVGAHEYSFLSWSFRIDCGHVLMKLDTLSIFCVIALGTSILSAPSSWRCFGGQDSWSPVGWNPCEAERTASKQK